MARGFGTVLGVASTDRLLSPTNLTVANQCTIAGWIYINGLGGSSQGHWIANTNNVNTSSGFDSGVVTNTSTLRFRSHTWGSSPGIFTTPITPSVWHHVMIAYDRSLTTILPTMFVDGVSGTVSRTQVPGGTIGVAASPISIGAAAANVQQWDGLIGHVAVWNGILLAAPEAVMLASGVSPLMIRPDALFSYIPLDGINSPEQDLVGAPATVTGTKLAPSEPPMFIDG